MKKLTAKELEEVASFIRKRGFTYVDVQLELLDHVASRVEEIMGDDSHITLESAIQKAHHEFGIFGFSGVEDAVIAGLTKKYNRFFWSNFLSFFGSKYVLLVVISGYSIYKLQTFLDSKTGMTITAFITLLAAIVCLFKLYKPEYKEYLAYRLSTAYFIGLGSFFSLMNLIIHQAGTAMVFGVNRDLAIFSAFLVCFILYFVSAIQTAKSGIAGSEQIRQKYQLA